MGEERPQTDRTAQDIAELQKLVRALEDANRANGRSLEEISLKIAALKGTPEATDTTNMSAQEPEKPWLGEVVQFTVGLLVVAFFAACDAYFYNDQAFGPLVRVVPLTLVAAGVFGVYAGFRAGEAKDFKWFVWGGLIVGVVATGVLKVASVEANASPAWFPPESLRLMRSVLKMGIAFLFAWMLFTSCAYLGKLAALRRRRPGGEEFLKTIASVSGAIIPLLASVIAALSK